VYYGAKYYCTTQENYLSNCWSTSLLHNRNFATSNGHKFCAQGGISFPNPPHTSPLFTFLSLISSEPGGSTDICQQRRSTTVGTYMKSQTRIQSSAHARPSMLYFSNSRVDMM